ncbi:CmpA/NrtA family ABC transporter substrate-binding protein [Roseiterribacter gracilis]|uniref:Nitrate transporter n=1 Tax=Roseiterribacter gracilis TaxID=2812848 RepID=A0A8S8XKL3_9PROT|nr:nitrate transporter [Rhodospirillales bacterium TMPK1]
MARPTLTILARGEPMRLGLLRLTDAAPLIVAAERGLFADEGLTVALSIEPSWSNIADKLTWGALDGAVLLAPLAIAMALGARGVTADLAVPMTLSRNGVTLTQATGFDLDGAVARGARPRIGIVHAFSTHHLLTRLYLKRRGIDPDKQIAWDVLPPARMVEALADRRIDAFAAGQPWSEMAARAGAGTTCMRSSEVWPNHPEKLLAVSASLSDRDPMRLAALVRATLRAALWCDDAGNADELANLLAQPRWFDLPADAIRTSLPGAAQGNSDAICFFADGATIPDPDHAAWFSRALAGGGWLPLDHATEDAARALYRPQIVRSAAADLAISLGDAGPILPPTDGELVAPSVPFTSNAGARDAG